MTLVANLQEFGWNAALQNYQANGKQKSVEYIILYWSLIMLYNNTSMLAENGKNRAKLWPTCTSTHLNIKILIVKL